MKLTKQATDWVLIKANRHQSGQLCDFVLLHLTIDNRVRWKFQITTATAANKTKHFFCCCFWENPVGWYIHNGEGIAAEMREQHIEWSYFEWDSPEEFASLTETDYPIKGNYLRVFASGTAQFYGADQHTPDEYWTDEFPLNDLVNKRPAE